MRINKEKAYRSTYVAEYKDLGDFAFMLQNRKPEHVHSVDSGWAGGSEADVINKCRTGDAKWTKRTEKVLDKITNIGIRDYAIDLDYNLAHGVLDYGAMVAGDPMCVYGTTITETAKAPVAIYLDNWISSTVPNRHIERRGVAIMALVQALAIYRPVLAKVIGAAGFSGDNTNDNIQIIPVPTHPMDIGRSAFMLCDPMFARAGVYQMTNTIHNMSGYDSGPMMGRGNGKHWQSTQLGEWAAKRDGITDHVFLPMMFQGDHAWSSDTNALEWVQQQINRFKD